MAMVATDHGKSDRGQQGAPTLERRGCLCPIPAGSAAAGDLDSVAALLVRR
jgi:hypothetical protein